MRLKEPIAVRERLAHRGWKTIATISSNLDTSTNTVSRALRGLPIRLETAMRLAQALDTTASEIAEVVEE